MLDSLGRTETRPHLAASRGDELRRQAETCRQLAASSLMERHKLVWLRLADEWLELARRADAVVVSSKWSGPIHQGRRTPLDRSRAIRDPLAAEPASSAR
jgi:hypothetical protein